MSWWLATIITVGGFVFLVLGFILSLEALRVLMLKLGRTWKDIPYPDDPKPPFGLSLVAPFLTDKQGKTHLGAYLVDYDREAHTAKALWIIKPNLHQDV